MGLAASQGRFLTLTARKTDLEYQGQQINQTRMNLSQQSAGLFSQLLAMQVPIPPDPTAGSYTTLYDQPGTDDDGNPITIPAGQVYTYTDTAAYNIAKAAYDRDLSLYNSKYTYINGLTDQIHQQDRNLEVLLKNIDTQQQAVQTEMDAVQKIIDKNIDMTFKTFA